MKEKTGNIENFIGIYDNYITDEMCQTAIKFFENESKLNKTLNRIGGENASVLDKKDQQYFAQGNNIDVWWDELKALIFNFDLAWKNYVLNTGAAKAYGSPFHYTNLKIQKTLPTEGYHVWHVEHNQGFHNEARAFVIKLRISSYKDWMSYTLSDKLPNNIPKRPEHTYKNKGWINFYHWLGKEKPGFMTFNECKKYVKNLNLKNSRQYLKYKKDNKLLNLHSRPSDFYKKEGWIDWPDFLGNKR